MELFANFLSNRVAKLAEALVLADLAHVVVPGRLASHVVVVEADVASGDVDDLLSLFELMGARRLAVGGGGAVDRAGRGAD